MGRPLRSTARRISAAEQAACRLEESEARYRALVERLPVVTYTDTLEESSGWLYVSPQVEALLGYTPEEFRRNHEIWPHRIHAEDRHRVLAQLRACRTAALPFTSEYRFLRRDGRVVWLREEATVVRDTSGQPLCRQGVIQDITDRKVAEQRLADAQALSHVGSWEWDVVADELSWSDEHYRIFGLEPQARPITLSFILERVHPEDRAAVEGYALDVRRGIPRSAIEYRILRADGSERVLQAMGRADLDDGGRVVRLFGTVQDVTEGKGLDDAVRRSHRELQGIIQLASIGIYRSTPAGRFLMANPALARILGYDSPDELLTVDIARDVYLRAEERTPLVRMYEETRTPWSGELAWKKKDRTPIGVLVSVRAVRDEDDRVRYFEGFVQDITEHKRALEDLARSRSRLQDLARREHEARERERKVVAREIHDELGQALTALRMDLSWLLGRLPRGLPRLNAKAHAMVGVVDETIQTVRRIATRLRPPILDDLGLVAAIEWQMGEVAARTGIQCALDVPAAVRIDEARGTTVFRIFQEALTNVVRHAAASSVRIRLQATHDELVLEIMDDGRGVTAGELADHGALGLVGMRERAQAVGGTLDVRAVAGAGTTVTLRVPLTPVTPEWDEP